MKMTPGSDTIVFQVLDEGYKAKRRRVVYQSMILQDCLDHRRSVRKKYKGREELTIGIDRVHMGARE